MDIRQRVLEARLAEQTEKNPLLAKKMGIEIRYVKMSADCDRRYTQGNIKKNLPR